MGRLISSVNSIESTYEEARMNLQSEIEKASFINKYSLMNKLSKFNRVDNCLYLFSNELASKFELKEEDIEILSELKDLLGNRFKPIERAWVEDHKTFDYNQAQRLESSFSILFKAIQNARKGTDDIIPNAEVDGMIKEIISLYDQRMLELKNTQITPIEAKKSSFEVDENKFKEKYDELDSSVNGNERIIISFDDAFRYVSEKLKLEYISNLINELSISLQNGYTIAELDKLESEIIIRLKSVDGIIKSVKLDRMFDDENKKITPEAQQVLDEINDVINRSSGYYVDGKIEPDEMRLTRRK